ncbi:YfbK domain-containing protein [Aliiglaciecola litoralis]|uniref:VWA domain-containing protein n=1 Tax=Aliiglaciecola litoralis TaxID=582857 RepID=A0ABN1LCW0_9ALTE
MKAKLITTTPQSDAVKFAFAKRKQLVLGLLAMAVIGGCSTSNEQARQESDEAKQQAQQLVTQRNNQERQRRESEQHMIVVTGAKIAKQQSSQGEIAQSLASDLIETPTFNKLIETPTLMAPAARMHDNPTYTEQYHHTPENGVFTPHTNPLSTFSIDVDTASYSNVRRMLNQGYLPPADAVRIEELVNYFDYQYQLAPDNSHPFAIDTQLAVSPWDKHRVLMRIGIKAPKPEASSSTAKNLVFLLDVSGSMNSSDKLPLVKRALSMLTQQLSENDRVAIVVYAGASGVVLEPTSGNNKVKIEQALLQLSAGGSTNGGQGIELAYKLAAQSFQKGGVNRVILATDGDFNVGMVDHNQLIELVERQRSKGIELTTLGFGQGNFNDHLMEQLANKGNGNYAYIDSLSEARKVLVEELEATLQSVARDVKIQVEFNPDTVAEYRLIGYDNRALNSEDFNNDKVDAGEIGAGHTVTAFYELVLQGSATQVDPLRYQAQATPSKSAGDELAFVKLRYKPIDSDTSQLISHAVAQSQITEFAQQNSDFKFATAVVGFAQILKNSQYSSKFDLDSILTLANQNKGLDDYGYRAEFVSLIRMTKTLQPI